MPEDRTPARVKLEIYVPPTHLEAVVEALHAAGAGRVGAYDHCVSVAPVRGRWRALPGAEPFAGRVGEVEEAEELRVETRCPAERVTSVLAAVRAAHPYEEPVVDVLPLLDDAAAEEPRPAARAGARAERWTAGTACALVTLDATGAPHAIPVSAARADGEEPARVVLALALRRGSLERLRADPRAALLVVARGRAETFRGRVRVLEEGPAEAPRVAVLELTVEGRDDHAHPDTVVDAGAAWRWRTREAADRDAGAHAALARHLDAPPTPGSSAH